MSFILKDSNVAINLKLTSTGRLQLASGNLNFANYALGDSEIDYDFAATNDFNPEEYLILRPKDNNPNIKYRIRRSANDTATIFPLPSQTPNIQPIVNEATTRGFFTGITDAFTALTTTAYTKVVTATDTLDIISGDTTLALTSTTNIGIGDFLLVQWINPFFDNNLDSQVIDSSIPVPYIWYKVESINGNNVGVDKNLPDFNGSGGTLNANVYVFPSGDSISNYYGSQDPFVYWNDLSLSFDATCNVANDDVAVWNMNIIYPETVLGTTGTTTQVQVTDYSSNTYQSFTDYINYNRITPYALIHYTNKTINNFYGEALFEDTLELDLPTIMYWNSTGNTMGVTLKTDSIQRGSIPSETAGGAALNTEFRNLIDDNNRVVGRVFNDLKVITIEDPEIVNAMSFTSNRSWTLPPFQIINSVTDTNNLLNGSQDFYFTYLLTNDEPFSSSTGYGYGTTIHCGYIAQSLANTNGTSSSVEFKLNENALEKFYRDTNDFIAVSGNGFTATKLYFIGQKVNSGERPLPTNWKIIDYTPNLNNYSTWSGSSIPLNDLANPFYRVTEEEFSAATTYSLSNFIPIPNQTSPDALRFGEETFFYGNVRTSIEAQAFRTTFNFVLTSNEFNVSNNVSFDTTNDSVYISELGIFDADNNLVLIGKINRPIEKRQGKALYIQADIDF